MKKNIKRGISLFLALVFVLTLLPAAALAADEDSAPKFKVVVSSKLNGSETPTEVIGTVDADYNAKLILPDANVNAGNVTISVEMNDVESLGGGNKSHSITLGTGSTSEGNLWNALNGLGATALADFKDGKITATIKAAGEAKTVVYTLKGNEFDMSGAEGTRGDKIITGMPNSTAAARDAWHLMVNDANFNVTPQTPDDSYFTVANGSWLQIGKEKLEFTAGYTEDLTVGKTGVDTGVEEIKAAVVLNPVEESALAFSLKAGTVLAVGGSVAMLTKDVNVTVEGADVSGLTVLSDLRAAVNGGAEDANAVLGMLIGFMNTAIELVEENNLDVTIEFVEPVLPKFEVVVSSKLTNGSVTKVIGTVDAGYNAKLVLPDANVNAGNVTIGVEMNDVASLGGGNKSHSITLGTGSTSEGNLWNALNGLGATALANFKDGKITATIKAAGGEKTVVYTFAGNEFNMSGEEGSRGNKVITGTPNSTAAARDAWHLMVNKANFNVAPQTPDDSYFTVANGSWLQIGKEKLEFTAGYTDDLTVGKTGVETGVEDIQDAVVLNPVEESALAFSLKAGTVLAVGGSVATLAKDVNVTVEGADVSGLTVLSDLRAAVNGGAEDANAVLGMLIGFMNTAIEMVEENDLDVTIEFVEPYTVTFMNGAEVVATQVVNGGDAAVEPDVELTQEGYTFAHWSLIPNGDAYDFETAVVTENVTLYAVWAPITYTVVFDGVDADSVVVEYDAEVPAPTPERAGWVFQGWATEPDGELVYAVGTTIKNLTAVNETVTLYPVWGNHTHNFQLVEDSWNWADDFSRATAEFTCDQCDEYTEEAPFVQVAAITSRVMRMPTCSVEGERRYTATALFVTDTKFAAIPTIPHTTVDMTLAATCTSAGREGGLVCTVCNTVVEEPVIVPSLGHHWDAGVVTTPAGYGTEGVRTYTCLNDPAHTYTETIPALVAPGGSTGGTTITDNDVPLASALPFDDVAETDWYYDAVKYVYENDLMAGIDDTTFDPYMDTTRGMIVTILYRLEGSPAVTGSAKFADVASGDYYHDAVVWGTANGIIAGYDETTYGPADIITREQFAAILQRYAAYKKYDVKVAEDASLDFTDADKVSEYAESALLWTVEKELIRGMGDGTVSPNTGATRAQAATILMGFCEKIAK